MHIQIINLSIYFDPSGIIQLKHPIFTVLISIQYLYALLSHTKQFNFTLNLLVNTTLNNFCNQLFCVQPAQKTHCLSFIESKKQLLSAIYLYVSYFCNLQRPDHFKSSRNMWFHYQTIVVTSSSSHIRLENQTNIFCNMFI